MNIIEEVIERLAQHPNVKYRVDGNWITILPTSNDGFEVCLSDDDGEYTVYYDGWHEHFDDASEALNCLAFGLSTDCRLKEYVRGGSPYKWTVEFKEDEKWVEEGTTALVFYPFWRRKSVRYLQNSLITDGKDIA